MPIDLDYNKIIAIGNSITVSLDELVKKSENSVDRHSGEQYIPFF